MLNTLKLVAARLDSTEYPWLLSGSTAMTLHGVPTPSRDLMILTERVGAYDFGHQFRKDNVVPVQASRVEGLTVHSGTFRIVNTTIEVIGDPVIQGENILAPLPVREIYESVERMDVAGQAIPVLPLEWIFFQEMLKPDNDALLEMIADEAPDQHQVFELLQRFGVYKELRGKVQDLLR